MNAHLAPYVLKNGGSAKETLDGIAADWKKTIAENGCKEPKRKEVLDKQPFSLFDRIHRC